jgi:uncharacterized protein
MTAGLRPANHSIVHIDWQGEEFVLLPDKAVHWPRGRTLFIADPHFGKTATFRDLGLAVPEATTDEDCDRLSKLLEGAAAERLVVLGDFLHSSRGRSEVVRARLLKWREANAETTIDLVRGNHDLGAGDPWSELGVECHPEPWAFKSWICRHEPATEAAGPELAGHLHPGITLGGARTACFWIGSDRIILPAFGSFTGTHVIEPRRGDSIYVTDGSEVIGIPV